MSSTRSFARGMAARGVLAALLAAFVTLAGTACGQRGPLYLPDQAPENAAPAEDAAPASDPEAFDATDDPADDLTDDPAEDEDRQ